MINEGENISVCMAGCLIIPERIRYMEKSIESLIRFLPKSEYIIGLDRGVKEPDGWRERFPVNMKIKVHDNGLGHSWNWAYKESNKKYILHMEEDWAVLEPENFQKIFSGAIEVVEKYDGIFRFDNMCQDFWKSGWTHKKDKDFEYFELNRPPNLKDLNMYYYSNRPHLRKNNLSERLELWNVENASPPIVEFTMCEKYYNTGQRVHFHNSTSIGHIGDKSIRDI